MDDKTIFAFWEPANRLHPYLELCMATWARNLAGYRVVLLDYTNLREYLDEDTFDPILFRKFPLMLQKDAVQVAVLKKHGGVFMDCDTIVVGDIAPIVAKLDSAALVLFWTHLGFMAARADSRVMAAWLERIQDKLASFRRGRAPKVEWNYFGNSILDELVAEASEADVCRLDKLKYGFTPETTACASEQHPEVQYRELWFESDASLESVFCPDQSVIALHNSWTPRWYKLLSADEVLENRCVLSRTLRHVLGYPPALPGKTVPLARKAMLSFKYRLTDLGARAYRRLR